MRSTKIKITNDILNMKQNTNNISYTMIIGVNLNMIWVILIRYEEKWYW